MQFITTFYVSIQPNTHSNLVILTPISLYTKFTPKVTPIIPPTIFSDNQTAGLLHYFLNSSKTPLIKYYSNREMFTRLKWKRYAALAGYNNLQLIVVGSRFDVGVKPQPEKSQN